MVASIRKRYRCLTARAGSPIAATQSYCQTQSSTYGGRHTRYHQTREPAGTAQVTCTVCACCVNPVGPIKHCHEVMLGPLHRAPEFTALPASSSIVIMCRPHRLHIFYTIDRFSAQRSRANKSSVLLSTTLQFRPISHRQTGSFLVKRG
jgi:hypothetical protein